ncbi:hypothetical protein PanWU01x14_176390 [Parasponia andersonii]|uniref:Uncharacterized protein n=1 Tax=Parasponia andersonii TaxID=3476 RepID=A0A2P5C7M7_PARAD|nr:hypothetical protein PanWU01x14_176390 [Parasponia andersonii]
MSFGAGEESWWRHWKLQVSEVAYCKTHVVWK